MPKFYCDYCDIYLAHSSIGGRRQHCIGRKHIQNKIEYYQRSIREMGLPVGGPMAGPGGPPFMRGPPPMPTGDPTQALAMFHAMMQHSKATGLPMPPFPPPGMMPFPPNSSNR